jgi:hypothetical protein
MTEHRHFGARFLAESTRMAPMPDTPQQRLQGEQQESLWSILLPSTPLEVVTRSVATAGLQVLLYIAFVLLWPLVE